MKILTISNCPLIDTQGSGYVINNYCQRLRARGHAVDLLGPDAYEPCRFLKGKAKSYRQAVGMLWIALRNIRQKKYDVIEFYGGQSWLAASVVSKREKRDYIVVSHSNGLETHYAEVSKAYWGKDIVEGSKRKWYQVDQTKLFERAFTTVDGIITVSEFDVRYALQHNYQDCAHIMAINNSLSEDFLALKVNFGRPSVIGYCGSWLARKGIETLQKDIPLLLRAHPDWSLNLVGVGRDFNKQTSFPNDVHDRIEVTPFVESKNELKKIYEKISILVMPSVYESFGLVTTEAMACGCALVATRTGFPASLVHRKEAWLMENPKSPLLFEGVHELIKDEGLRLQIARNGYERVQSLHWDRATDIIENTYQTWLKEKHLA